MKQHEIIPIQNREPDVEAIFENCRESKNYFASGYRPAHLVKDNYLTTGSHMYYDMEKIEYGQTAKGTITFIAPEHHMSCFTIGKRIPFQEGAKIHGYATITKIFNKHLEQKDTYFIPKDKMKGSCYFEFFRGKYRIKDEMKLDCSLFIYGGDLNAGWCVMHD